jgi:peptide/nickel transport system ATP-binding protein
MPTDALKFEARDLTRTYGHRKKMSVAVDHVSFGIRDREIVSIVGQSGCGKTVLAKMLLRLETPSSGALLYDAAPIEARDRRAHWREVQAVFQDPFSAFNQFFTIRSQLKSSFRLFEKTPTPSEMEERVDQALLAVNILPREIEGKYPFELSGGQMQRMLLARIFILRPRVLVADEPTSMVDACSRASILEYLMKLKRDLEMTIVFNPRHRVSAHTSPTRSFSHKGRSSSRGRGRGHPVAEERHHEAASRRHPASEPRLGEPPLRDPKRLSLCSRRE